MAFPGLSGLSGCDRVLAASSGSSSLLPVAFHTAARACPLQKPLTSNLRRASVHAPLGGRKVFSSGFETAACPPPKPSYPSQRLEPAPAPIPPERLQPCHSSNKTTFAAPRACPRSKAPGTTFGVGLQGHSSHELGIPPCSVQWPFQVSVAFLAVTASWQHPVALPASSSPATAPTKKPSIHEPLGGRKVFSYGFETAACPPRNLQMLRSASRLPWLLQKPLTSNRPNSSNKKTFHPRAAGWPQSLFLRFRDRRLPPSKPSNASQRLAPAVASAKASNLQPPPLVWSFKATQAMSLASLPAASSGLSRSQWPFWL